MFFKFPHHNDTMCTKATASTQVELLIKMANRTMHLNHQRRSMRPLSMPRNTQHAHSDHNISDQQKLFGEVGLQGSDKVMTRPPRQRKSYDAVSKAANKL